MAAPLCRVDAAPPCGWSRHAFKHFPFPGMTRDHTLAQNPARYLPEFDATRIRETEMATARAPELRRARTVSKIEYVREVGDVIGWDLGQDATVSFVECSGGDVARTFHGRPLCRGNLKLASF